MSDTTKRITADIRWRPDAGHCGAAMFDVSIDAPYRRLSALGWMNSRRSKLNFNLIHEEVGLIYAVHIGSAHHNPTCERIKASHQHLWDEHFEARFTRPIPGIDATARQLERTWDFGSCAVRGETRN